MTEVQRLTWEQYLAGEPCRGCVVVFNTASAASQIVTQCRQAQMGCRSHESSSIEWIVARHPHPQQGQHVASRWITRVTRHSGQQPSNSVRPALLSTTRDGTESQATASL